MSSRLPVVSFVLDDVLGALPRSVVPTLLSLIREADRSGVTLHLVGGPVRDLILERPVVDIDLVVEPANEIDAAALASRGAPAGAQVEVHERFGTVIVRTADASVDLATARSEEYRHAGALPRVRPGSLREDLARRDFSVNALALRLTRDKRHSRKLELFDPEGGLADLAERRLRVLHARSFHDDPTRALRAARLAPRLGFALSRRTHSALRDALRDGAFGAVSGDRLRREIEKLFADASRDLDPAVALGKLSSWHVLQALEPGLDLPRAAVGPVRRLGRAIAAPPWRGPRHRPWASGLAVWLSPLPGSLRRRVLERLSVRGELTERIHAFPTGPRRLLEPLAAARGRGAVDSLLAGIDEDQLYALYAWAPTAARRRIVRWAAEDRVRRAPLSGTDLTDVGLSGPEVGRVLARVRAAHLDGAVANREEAIALARELARQAKTAPKRARKVAGKRVAGKKVIGKKVIGKKVAGDKKAAKKSPGKRPRRGSA